jgi:hypothetical protein
VNQDEHNVAKLYAKPCGTPGVPAFGDPPHLGHEVFRAHGAGRSHLPAACLQAYRRPCVTRLWVWMICRDGISGFVDFYGSCGLIGRLVAL